MDYTYALPRRRWVAGFVSPVLVLTLASTPALAAPPQGEVPPASGASPAGATEGTAATGAANLPDSSLEALVGKDVTVTSDGSTASGNLAAFDASSITIIDAAGQIVLVPRSSVVGIKVAVAAVDPAPPVSTTPAPAPVAAPVAPTPVPVPVQPKSTKGTGLIVTGAILVPLGGLMVLVGTAVGGLVFEFDEPQVWAPAAGVGTAMLLTGIPLLIVGSSIRNKANSTAKAPSVVPRIGMAPMLGRDRVGGGLQLRF